MLKVDSAVDSKLAQSPDFVRRDLETAMDSSGSPSGSRLAGPEGGAGPSGTSDSSLLPSVALAPSLETSLSLRR